MRRYYVGVDSNEVEGVAQVRGHRRALKYAQRMSLLTSGTTVVTRHGRKGLMYVVACFREGQRSA